MANGKIWTRQRRFTLSTFRDFGIGKSRFQDQIANEVAHLKEELAKNITKPIDPHKYVATAISNVICSVVLGKRFEYTDENFIKLLDDLDAQVEASASAGIVHFVPILANLLPGFKELTLNTSKNISNFIQSIINDHKTNFDRNDLKDYVDVYLNEFNKQSDENEQDFSSTTLTDQHLLHSVTQLFVAGSETTVTTLRWCFLYMMAYPDIQSRVQEEIDSVVGRNRLPRLSDKLPFTEATIMEVQRIASIVPIGVPHVAAEDTSLQGFFIPQGTILLSNIWAIHHNEDVWPQPDKFKPERFLKDDGSVHQPEENYAPFSIGKEHYLQFV